MRFLLALALLSSLITLAGGEPAAQPSSRPAPKTAGALKAGFRWPLAGEPAVARRFDPPPRPWLAGHRGVDLVGKPGQAVLAPADGEIAFAGSVAGRGVVSVAHANGLRTTYEPVRALVPAGDQVKAGDRVKAGDAIGSLEPGHAGCPAEACLHWGARRGEDYLDPLLLIGLGRVRLKPLDASTSRARSLRDPGYCGLACAEGYVIPDPATIKAAIRSRASSATRPPAAARRFPSRTRGRRPAAARSRSTG